MLISLDPGRAGLGWAAFSLRPAPARLLALGVVRQPKGPRDYEQASLEAVAENAATEILRAVQGLAVLLPSPFTRAIVERMTSYPQQKAFAANDLLDLQAIGGMVAGALCPLSGIRWIRPAEWKGQTKTEALEARLPMVLSPEELALWEAMRKKYGKTLGHNGSDALAMGLHWLKKERLR